MAVTVKIQAGLGNQMFQYAVGRSLSLQWAAWLGQAPEKIVIAPKIWYSSEKHQNKDPVPDSWIRL